MKYKVKKYQQLLLLGPVMDPARNTFILSECHPHTEIFSKRRKIYSRCVEDLSKLKMVDLKSLTMCMDQVPLHKGLKVR